MSPNWLVVASPLVLLGVPLILFADRNLDHQRQNMREGKEYLWQRKFRGEIGDLIHEIEESVQLSTKLVRMKEKFDDPNAPNPGGVSQRDDIPSKILQEVPFTPKIREVTDSMGEHSSKITELEQDYQELERDLRILGISFIAAYGTLAVGQLHYGNPLPDWIFVAFVLVLLFGGNQGWDYIKKKRELRVYSDKYENHREL